MKSLFFIASVAAVLSVSVRATDAQDVVTRTGLSEREMSEYLDKLTGKKEIVKDFDVRVRQGKLVYDVSSQPNPGNKAWVLKFNISDSEFKAFSAEFSKAGFEIQSHRTLTVNRRKRHSAVWVQNPESGEDLELPEGPIPESGQTGADLEPLNDLMRTFLREHNIPGATLAISHQGSTIFERGFGYADVESRVSMPANANMRIASLSKSITAVAILMLVQEGRLSLDQTLLYWLAKHPSEKFETEGAIQADSRWAKITVRHLLHHSGGWDRDKSKDTVFQLAEVTQVLKKDSVAQTPDLVRYQLGRPLDFEPGSQHVYSNVGYCMLGRVIEAVTNEPYESFVRTRILNPAMMSQTRLGKTRLNDRALDEVTYYTQKRRNHLAIWDLADSRNKGNFEMVPEPYGAWDLEVMDSFGGWTSTAPDLIRFMKRLSDDSVGFLESDTRRLMLAAPPFSETPEKSTWYGFGFNVRTILDDDCNFWHTGSLAGTSTLMVHRWDGYDWAVLFNVDRTKTGERCSDLIDRELHRAVNLAAKR